MHILVQSNTYAGRGSLTSGNNAPLNNPIMGNATGVASSNANVNSGSAPSNIIMQTSYTK